VAGRGDTGFGASHDGQSAGEVGHHDDKYGRVPDSRSIRVGSTAQWLAALRRCWLPALGINQVQPCHDVLAEFEEGQHGTKRQCVVCGLQNREATGGVRKRVAPGAAAGRRG
jgi:hypothetical protein